MRKTGALLRSIVLLSLLLFFPSLSFGQLVLGQYESEAPLRTWNVFGLATAAALGRGETMFTSAADCSAALVNPGLLADLPRFTATLSGSTSSASLFRYGVVNTGVLSSGRNLNAGATTLDFAGFSLNYRGWVLAASAALSENYDRPWAYVEQAQAGFVSYTFSFRQEGVLRLFNISLARRINRTFRVGLGLNFVRGSLERKIRENFIGLGENTVISDEKSQDFSGFYLNGGITAGLTDRLVAALVFRAPYSRRAQSASTLQYSAPLGDTEITIEAESADRIRQPWVIGLGAGYRLSARFRVLSEATFFDWSEYEVEYFGEPAERNFRDTLKLSLGAEHDWTLRLSGEDASIILRAGVNYDPQPMAEPRSGYTNLTLGGGLRWRRLALDLGGLLGRESGSGNDLQVKRLVLTASVRL